MSTALGPRLGPAQRRELQPNDARIAMHVLDRNSHRRGRDRPGDRIARRMSRTLVRPEPCSTLATWLTTLTLRGCPTIRGHQDLFDGLRPMWARCPATPQAIFWRAAARGVLVRALPVTVL